MNSFEQVKSSDSNLGAWSNFVKHLDRIVYKNELPSFTKYLNDSKPETPVKNAPQTTMGKLLTDFKVGE